MGFFVVVGNKMKTFIYFTNSLQKSITQNNLTCIVPFSILNQKVLHILQINGYINGFHIKDSKKILVYLSIKII